MRVLVCGGRDYEDETRVGNVLDGIRYPSIGEIIHGGAPGADTLANSYASINRLPVQIFRADWKRYGNRAGPIRNQRMLDEGKPDLVVAFPGGRGTADMVRRAKAAGVRVIEVEDRR